MTDVSSIAKYQPQRDQYWPEVEQFFSNLPPNLFRQGVLLKNNLAIVHSDTGQFKDILGRDRDHPLLYLHFWLLDDLQFPNTAERTNLEKRLFLAMTFAFASVYTQQTILDEGSSFDNSFLLLEQVLIQQADFHLAHLYPGQSLFWSHHQAFWQEYAEAVLLPADDPTPIAGQETLEGVGPIARKLAFTKIPLTAVAINIGQEAMLPRLLAMMDRLNLIFQTMRDFSTLRRDLMQRDYTYPLIRAMQEAGIDPHQTIMPERILGALVLTGTIEKICRESLSHLDICRNIANELNLPTFTAHFAVVEDLIAEVKQLFSLKAKSAGVKRGPLPKKPSRPFFQPYANTLNTAVEMAEGYLLSDLTFRESWEVQRGGLLNLSQIVAKAFPGGLIIEALCQNGQKLSAQVDDVFQTLYRNRFRYYDDVQLPPDADDLGLLLRLYRYSGQKEAHRKMLQTPLRWMKESILPSGQIPVWFKADDEATNDDERFPVLIWGNSCATTETNLLLGLADYDWTGYRGIIENSTLNLLERFRANGLGASLYYLPPYILWVAFELISQLSAKSSIGTELQEALDRANGLFLERFEVEITRHTISPQDAAFLTLTCHSAGSDTFLKSLFEERWIRILLKGQRHDGSWDDEPLFLIPDWRGTAWYASRSVTTAFCYHALKTFQKK